MTTEIKTVSQALIEQYNEQLSVVIKTRANLMALQNLPEDRMMFERFNPGSMQNERKTAGDLIPTLKKTLEVEENLLKTLKEMVDSGDAIKTKHYAYLA